MKTVFCRWTCLLLLSICHGASAGWFAEVNDAHYPWLYHADHGWMYASESSGGGMWMWDTGLGWVWTSESAYPRFYEPLAGWVEYKRGSQAPRQFLDLSTSWWLEDEALPIRDSYFPIPLAPKTFVWFYTVNNGEPVTGTVDGVTMSMKFQEYRVDLSTTHMRRTTSLGATLSGSVDVEGTLRTFDGSLHLKTDQSLGQGALGLFEKEIDLWMRMYLVVDNQGADLTAQAKVSGFDQYLMVIPWQNDLFEEPVGKTFHQEISSGSVAGTVRFELTGQPESKEEESFDIPFDPSPTLHMEIVAKHDHYFLSNGHPFQRVVEVVVTQTIPDPTTGTVQLTESRMWLAPGIGMIKMIEDNPVTDEPILVEYSHSWM